MNAVTKTVDVIVKIAKYIGMICIAFVMLIVAIGVISRLLGNPILGTNEIAEILHVLIVMFALVYTQSKKEHITVGLIVDRLPKNIQFIFDVISHILTIAFCALVGYIFLGLISTTTKSTLLLSFPHSILKIFIAIGFFVWALVALVQLIAAFIPNKKEVGKDV